MKEFKDFQSQIKLLELRGLFIDSENRLEEYLKDYSYQKVINGYNDPFFLNNDRRTNLYENSAKSSMILNLFDLDFYIKQSLTKYLIRIENKLNAALLYCIWREMSKIDTQWCSWATKQSDFSYNSTTNKWILNNSKIDNFKNSIFDSNISNNRINDLINRTLKNCDVDDNLFKEFSNDKKTLICAPFYKMALKWDFGTSLTFWTYLKKDLKRDILKMICINDIDSNIIFHFFLDIIRQIRNKVAHNEVLYRIKFDYYKWLQNKGLLSQNSWTSKFVRKLTNSNSVVFRFTKIFTVIAFFCKIEDSYLDEYKEKVNAYLNEIKNCSSAFEYIKNFLEIY